MPIIANNRADDCQKQVDLLRRQLKQAQEVAKAVWSERATIEYIKEALEKDNELMASEAWNELDFPVQKLLITAPTKGGPFTTAERAIVKSLWQISADDMG